MLPRVPLAEEPAGKPGEKPLRVTPDPRPAPNGPAAPVPSMSNEAIVFHAKVASTKVTVEFTDARPVEILDVISSNSGIPIEIDGDAATALAAAERTSISFKDLPMTAALQLLLNPAHVHAEIGESSIVVRNH